MNKKTEDQLVRLAFGDLSPEEATQLRKETEGKPEAKQTLDAYRRMKDELRNLAEVPADQLSKERLREAILARGLKERPARRSISWLWVPTAAAALAFGVTFFKGSFLHDGGTPAVIGGGSNVVASLPTIGPKMTISAPPETHVATSEEVASAVKEDTTPKPKHRHHSTDYSGSLYAMNNTGEAIGNTVLSTTSNPVPSTVSSVDRESVETTKTTASPAGRSAVAPPAAAKPATEAPIILIQPEKDSSTGARKATEVESASNVLVGG